MHVPGFEKCSLCNVKVGWLGNKVGYVMFIKKIPTVATNKQYSNIKI